MLIKKFLEIATRLQLSKCLNNIFQNIENKETVFEVFISIEINSKQTSIEIEQLNARVVEAETRLKTEVQRIKKKLQIQITELELSLDVANKNNIDLQKTIKKQALTLTVILTLTFSNMCKITLVVHVELFCFSGIASSLRRGTAPVASDPRPAGHQSTSSPIIDGRARGNPRQLRIRK